MIRARVIPRLLEQLHEDGIQSSLFFQTDGCLLGAAGLIVASGNSEEASTISSILSNAWEDYSTAGSKLKQHSGELECIEIDLEKGRLASVRVGSRYIAAVCGENVTSTALRKQLDRFRQSVEVVLKDVVKKYDAR